MRTTLGPRLRGDDEFRVEGISRITFLSTLNGFAFAGMAIGVGRPFHLSVVPVESISMRLSGHALPRAKWNVDPGDANKKCRVDQAQWIHHPSVPEAPVHNTLFGRTAVTAKRCMKLDDAIIRSKCGITQCLPDILFLKIRIVGEHFIGRHTVAD
jgi:hypothetical protein